MIARVGTINTPRKSFLLPPSAQGRALRKLYRENKVGVSVQPESYTALNNAINSSPRYRVIMPGANNVFNGGNHRVGTAIVVDVLRYKVIDVENLRIDWAERPRHGLNMPVVLLKDRLTGYRFAVIGVHIPTRRDASQATRDRINNEIHAYAQSLFCPVIIAGDFNDGTIMEYYNGFTNPVPVTERGIDNVIVNGFKAIGHDIVTAGIHNRITDHHSLVIGKFKTFPTQTKSRMLLLPKA